jgi:hypothetical protein
VALALDGCRAKLDWAEKHLDALSAEMKTWFEGDSYTLRTEFDEPDESSVVFFEPIKEIPIHWGLALGDVVHNARSALDHLVYQLVLLANSVPHDAHQFPVLDQPEDWKRRVQKPPKGRRGLLDFIDPTHVATIQGLQPYVPATGLPRLKVLREFSNTDKHRVIHAARGVFTEDPGITSQLRIPMTITDVRTFTPGTPIEGGAEIARFRSHTELAFPPAQSKAPTSALWFPGKQEGGGFGNPLNSQVHVDMKLKVTTVFGIPGTAYTSTAEFRSAIHDVRAVIASFDPAFPTT